MGEKLLTKQDLIDRWGISESQFAKMKAAGRIPQVVKLSERVHRWRESDVINWESKAKAEDSTS